MTTASGTDWADCDAIAERDNPCESDGLVNGVVLTCDLPRHAAPGDATVMHHDPCLDIMWRFAE